ncbi:Uncharacterised protein [Vibrio cholerae]|nr:Uncharacterised protein [Vibrio cholerae]
MSDSSPFVPVFHHLKIFFTGSNRVINQYIFLNMAALLQACPYITFDGFFYNQTFVNQTFKHTVKV